MHLGNDKNTSPSGGNGWLFLCAHCEFAFEFARAVKAPVADLEDIARQQTPRVQKIISGSEPEVREEVKLATPDDWLNLIRPLQAELVEGQRYVFFDGCVLPAVHGPVKFRGLWRSHDLPDLPHLSDAPENDVLTDIEYWEAEMPG